MKRRLACLPMAWAVAVTGAASSAQVTLRAGDGSIEGRVRSVSIEGVLVTLGESGATQADQRLIGWDRVKLVEGEAAQKAAQFTQLSTEAWRARSRAERGDWGAAEPLFEHLFTQLEGKDGPTAALVAEGLLRCRLRRGAQGVAVWPWLEWLGIMERSGGLGAAGSKTRAGWLGGNIDPGQSGAAGRAVDEETGLAVALPPVWVGGSAGVLAGAPEWERFRDRGGEVGELAALYEQASRYEAGLPVGVPTAGSESPGVRLVHDIVVARIGSDEERKAARSALNMRISPAPTGSGVTKKPAPLPPRWLEAWCRAAIGRSLLREADEASRMQGVIELLHLPARFASDQPYLTGVALAEASAALADLGDAAGAAALKSDLASRFPYHPALEWGRINRPSGTGVQKDPERSRGGGVNGGGSVKKGGT